MLRDHFAKNRKLLTNWWPVYEKKSGNISISPSERYYQLFICSGHIFDPGLKPLEKQKWLPRSWVIAEVLSAQNLKLTSKKHLVLFGNLNKMSTWGWGWGWGEGEHKMSWIDGPSASSTQLVHTMLFCLFLFVWVVWIFVSFLN